MDIKIQLADGTNPASPPYFLLTRRLVNASFDARPSCER